MGLTIDRFSREDGRRMSYEDGDLLATVVFILGSWEWHVFHRGAMVAGRRDWDMDAMQACDEAVAAMVVKKAAG